MIYNGSDKHKIALFEGKQDKLTAGDNITLTPLADGTVRIDAEGGGGTVTDVQVDETSVVDEDGVAQIPAIPSELDDLDDVSISSPVIGEVLAYNPITQKWENGSGYDRFAPIIYSLEEREVGVFTDGKPLYQKTYVFNGLVQLNSNSWYDTGITLSESLKPIKFEGHAYWNDNAAFVISGSTNNNKISLIQFRNTAIQIDSFTMYYTKVSDTPGSGSWTPQGVPAHHYSTNEQVVGTWFNGKTLYEKTISFTTGSSNAYLTYLTDIQNPAEMMIVYDASYYVNGTARIGIVPYYGTLGSNDGNVLEALCAIDSGKIRIDYRVGESAYSKQVIMTLRYTKTTD